MASAKDSSRQALWQIDEICERFEAAWQDGRPSKLEDFVLGGLDPNTSRQLLRELVALDIEFRCRSEEAASLLSSHDGRRATKRSPSTLTEEYFDRFPELASCTTTQLTLAAIEFRARQQLANRPQYTEFSERFPRIREPLIQELRRVLTEMSPTEVKFFCRKQLVFSARLDKPLEIGRAKPGDPAHFYRVRQHDPCDRIIVAPPDDKTVSRTHVRLDLVDKVHVSIENISRWSCVLAEGVDVRPGTIRRCHAPVLIQIGRIVMRISSVCPEDSRHTGDKQ